MSVSQEVKKGGAKKGKKAGKGKAAVDDDAGSSNVRVKPCPSFFRFFLPDPDSSSSRSSKVHQRLHDPAALQPEEQEEDADDQVRGQQLTVHLFW